MNGAFSKFLQAIGCFSVLGPRQKDLHRSFSSYLLKGWRTPLISPILLNSRTASEAALQSVEDHFKKTSGKRILLEPEGAYFNVVRKTSVHDLKKVHNLAIELGWVLSPNLICINFWDQLEALNLPKGFSIKVGSYFDRALHKEARRLWKRSFGETKSFWDLADRTITPLVGKIDLVVLANSDARACAAGLVVTEGKNAFLMTGCVDPDYQGRGLWRGLIAARQMVSSYRGAQRWILTTENPRIRNRGNLSFEYQSYFKTP